MQPKLNPIHKKQFHISELEVVSQKEFNTLPLNTQRWLTTTSNKIVGACQTGVMMGTYHKEDFIGAETFRGLI